MSNGSCVSRASSLRNIARCSQFLPRCCVNEMDPAFFPLEPRRRQDALLLLQHTPFSDQREGPLWT